MKTFDPQGQPEVTAKKVRRVQNTILLVMALLMILPGLLAWYMGVIRF